MSAVRALPLCTAPVPGEALDSWLQAIAVRHTISLRDLYLHLGLGEVRDLRTRFTAATVTQGDAARIGAATGCTPTQIRDMTLSRFLASAVSAGEAAADPMVSTPRHHIEGWRFCPACLDASGGRWLLSWRLVWSFACLQHRCLLAERCPCCGARPRAPQPVNATPPHPGHCAHPIPTATGRNRARCDTDLADTPVTTLEPDHPALRAQQRVVDLLGTDTGRFGLYAEHPTPVPDVLADIRILGRAILSATAGRHLDDLLPADLATHYRQQRQPGTAAMPASVLTSAAAITAAVTVLSQPDLRSAAAPLAAFPDDISRYTLHQWTYGDRPAAAAASPVLQSVHLSALGDRLSPAAQLGCRLGSGFPHRHATDTRRLQRLLQALPTALWPSWAVRLSPPAVAHSGTRAALAAAVLLVGSDLDIGDAAAHLGGDLTRVNAVYLLWRCTESPHWPALRDALAVLSDYLNDHGAPIDYQRRRRLDYRDLLTQHEWHRICRQLGRQHHSAAHTRTYLQHRIAGTTQSYNDPAADVVLAEFPRRLTPDLSRALHDHARNFLISQGIQDEPVVWEPPTSIVADLDLPGADIADVDLGELHRLIRTDRCSITATSQQLGIRADVLRAALEQHPAPALPTPACTPRIGARRPGTVYQRAAQALPPHRLTALYSKEQRSLADIAALTGVSRPTVARLMCDYAIARRRPGGRPTATVDRDWLYTEHVLHHRSCADLARELHISSTTLAAQATTLKIPMPTVARHTEAELRTNPKVPAILIPALVGHGGWERLQRFAIIVQFRTLTEAGKHLGRGVAVTGSHIARLETDFRTRLLTQKPLQCTDFGNDVLAAVHRLADLGGP
ncbi:TniQ family protein [soil metagenome]